MPSFPQNGANMTREEALTMIIASIAMEELALSHILNAEGEKLQYILGTLPGASPCACPQHAAVLHYDSQSGSVPPGTRRQEITYSIPGADTPVLTVSGLVSPPVQKVSQSASILFFSSPSGSVPPGTRRQEITYSIPGADTPVLP